MDLYIQVGVILLFLAALSLFVYFYTQPAQQFTEGINSTTKELNQRLATASGVNLNQYHLNPSVSGAQVKQLIKDAEASKIGVLVQTKAQKGAMVNYGYQLREAHVTTPEMNPSVAVNPSNPTDYEINFVTDVGVAIATYELNTKTLNAVLPLANKKFYDLNKQWVPLIYDQLTVHLNNINSASIQGHIHSGNYDFVHTPTLEVNARDMLVADVKNKGLHTSSSGLLYTLNVIKENFEVNNFIMNTNKSPYYINPTSSFISLLVVDGSGTIVGIYLEERDTKELPLAKAIVNSFNK